MKQIIVESPAKLNWLLHVGPARPDGYHELTTVFQSLSFADLLQVEVHDEPTCELSGFPADIAPDKNLVVLAWKAMRLRHPDRVRGLAVSIEKRLPRGGGLGGGSSNAAAVLSAINTLYSLNLDPDELCETGGRIGADVPFFTYGGTALGRQRGDLITPLPDAPELWFVLVMPQEGMSTAAAFQEFDKMQRVAVSHHQMQERIERLVSALHGGNPEAIAGAVGNDFELVAESFAWYQEARQRLLDAGVLKTLLCGSGSTVAGLCRDEAMARSVALSVGGIATRTRPAKV